MKTSTLLEVLAAFNCEKPQLLNNMDPSDPSTQKARTAQDLFTGGVHVLRTIENPVISGLMSYVWDLFHHRHVLLAMGPDVPSLSFALAGGEGGLKALVFAPHNWPEMVRKDPLMQLGAIIANGSQCVDYYNDLIKSREDVRATKNRAESYEAEYLLMLGDHPLNEYQKGIRALYPKGFDPILGYPRKPIIATN
jgi:hypothetical protein